MTNTSNKTIDDIIRIVNLVLIKLRKPLNINENELEDLSQEGYIAAIEADRSYDPGKGTAWSSWIWIKVDGAIRNALPKLRNGGITYARAKQAVLSVDLAADRDKDDEELDSAAYEPVYEGPDTDEAADIAAQIATVFDCVSSRGIRLLSLYYGLDGDSPSLSTAALAHSIGHSHKHTKELLRRAHREARLCLGATNAGAQNSYSS